ncbi:MAG TPA: hypothetical protein VK735_39545 [Pseudonocardia sp.]|uniref:hypothetical protein n=1 Tax=Pseudonocardia sp. TaxID=60912 RepID=UPI002D1807F0|nr:hypothetical protein [Pseudonocardia sp.]HTF53577.1 hypothetical protein [Pseudonocardia sp.]
MERQGFIGKTGDGESVYVEITIAWQAWESESVPAETIDHHGIRAHERVSMMGHTFRERSRRRDSDGAGQIVDILNEITTPAPGWTLDEIGALRRAWERWHLNDMRAGCAHQTAVTVPDNVSWDKRSRYRLDNTPQCPETGYRWGSRWLVEPLTDDARAEIESLADKLDGTDGYRRP